jgi:phosphohistidine phosphatase
MLRDLPRVGEHSELVPGEGLGGENVADHVAEGGHALSLTTHILGPAMRVLIVRHAEAASGNPDELRPLTSEGREHARAVGARLREEGFAADAVVSSPLLRARETAEALGFGAPVVDERLAPGATPFDVRDAATGRGETVIVVGHQPDCGKAVAALSGSDEPAFPPCAHALVDLD